MLRKLNLFEIKFPGKSLSEFTDSEPLNLTPITETFDKKKQKISYQFNIPAYDILMKNKIYNTKNNSDNLERVKQELYKEAHFGSKMINSGDSVILEFNYKCEDPSLVNNLCFVFNLYRKDNVYICGTTTHMQKMNSFSAKYNGVIRVKFPSLKLLSGIYNWRVAVNDGDVIQIIDELLPVCEFSVRDSFEAVGIYDIEHKWSVEE